MRILEKKEEWQILFGFPIFAMLSRGLVSLLLAVTQCIPTQSSSRASTSFSPLPSLPAPVSDPNRSSHGLGGYYDLASGIVSTIRPGNLPHDTVADLAGLLVEHLEPGWNIPPRDADTREVINEFLRWFAPALAAVVLGLLMAVAIPITGCCILCCRASGHCGAKSRIYRKKNQNIKCFICTSFFLVMTAMILVGAILGMASVVHMSDSLKQLEPTFNDSIDDIANYLEGVVKQVDFIAEDQFGVLEANVLHELEFIGEWFEENIDSEFQSDALAVVNHAHSFLSTLLEIDNMTVSGNVLIEDLKNVTSVLVSHVSTLSEDIAVFNNVCTATLSALTCAFLSSTDFAVKVNYTDIGTVDFNNQVDLAAIEEQIQNATDIFSDIAHYIDTEAEEYQLSEKAKNEFEEAQASLRYDYLDSINETITETISDGGHFDDARSYVHDGLEYLDTYEPLWTGVALTLVCMFFLIVAFFLIGSFCGSFGYSRVAQPHSRSSVSNCGGRCILVGIVIAFVTSPVLLVATSVSYGLATGVQKVCDDLQPPNYHLLTEVADEPAVWGGVTLIGLISREQSHSTTTVNISLSQILTGCTENDAVWKALDGDGTSLADFDDDVVNCTTLGVGGDDFQPFDGFDDGDIFPSLADVNDSYNKIDFDKYENITSETTIVSFNVSELIANLTVLHMLFSNISDVGVNITAEIIGDLGAVELILNDLQNLHTYVQASVTELERIIASSEHELTSFSVTLDTFLAELPHAVGKATDDYINHLCGFVDDFINYANETFRNELGRCSAISVAYGALYTEVCENTLDGLNGYWLCIGWCMLFSTVAVVMGIVLSDYFRRASTRVVRCTDTSSSENSSLIPYTDDDDIATIHMTSKHPPRAPTENSLPEEQQPLHTTQMDMEW